ncbi:signal transduction histidine kinase [Opitutaceae bacterium TAV1]|nr:signal transduction histidine kinase [Opitutaceae bacterium TAV1]
MTDTASSSPHSPTGSSAGFTAALQRISALGARASDPGETMRAILGIVIEYFGASAGTISLLNPDTGKLEIDVHQGMPADIDEVVLRLGQGITGWVAFHGRPQLVPDVRADPRYIPVRPEVRSEMTAPFVQESGQVLGVINLDSDLPGAFAQAHLDELVRLADEATCVLLRVWQLSHLQGKARQLEALVAAGQALVTKLEPQELHDTITRDARKILGTRASALYLHYPARGVIALASFTSDAAPELSASATGPAAPGPAPLPTEELPAEACLVTAVLHTRKHVEFANIQSPEFLDVVDLPRDRVLRSMLAVPMFYEQEIVGVLAVFTDHVHRFNNDEKRLLAAFGSLAAVSLQNSRLYSRVFQSEESLRKNEQLTTLGLLAAEIAHEIRNPLTVIKLLFGYLGLDFPEGDPRRTDVRVIGEKLDQLEEIVSRVLTLAKAPTSLHSRWNLAEIIEDTIVLIRLKLAQGKIALRMELPPRPLSVDVNKGQIQQVLLNILLNSTQAMPEGGTITVRVASDRKDGAACAVVDVSDTGRGIPGHISEKIFESFLSTRPDGTGLGLAIAKRILLSHHGDISLHGTGPDGTTIRIRLPLAP